MSQTIVSPLSREKIKLIATKVREMMGIPVGRFPIVEVLEILSIPDENSSSNFEMEILEDSEMPDEYATYSPATNTLHIRQSVYLGATQNVGRDVFTLAHELGHMILHRKGYSFARSRAEVPAYRDPEWQANVFASMLLLPRDQIVGMDAQEAAEKFGTSLDAARIALQK